MLLLAQRDPPERQLCPTLTHLGGSISSVEVYEEMASFRLTLSLSTEAKYGRICFLRGIEALILGDWQKSFLGKKIICMFLSLMVMFQTSS